MTTLLRVRALIARLKYSKPGVVSGFDVMEKNGLVFLRHWQYDHAHPIQYGRKWYISEHMVDSEIIQTALLATLTFEEHEARENLTFDGRRLYSPHRSIVDLDKEVEVRKPSPMPVRSYEDYLYDPVN